MIAQSSRSMRHALVIALVILSALVVVERGQAMVSAAHHALMIDRAAPVLELAAANHDHHYDHHPDHHDWPLDALADSGDNDPAPGPHHHHSEGPQVAALTSPAMIVVAVSDSAALFISADTGSPQSRIFGLERPPKALIERA